jgi:hypothetical protein
VRPSSRYIMFGDSGRLEATEDEVFCAPAVATDPAAAVAIFRKFLRSMKTSIQTSPHTDANETAEFTKTT